MKSNPPDRVHALTIDVEDYHNLVARDWLRRDGPPTDAVVRNTRWFLNRLAAHDVRATFFVLGEVAEHYPELVRAIGDGGHELGVHGYHHRQVFRLTAAAFRAEINRAREVIEQAAGIGVAGHRAPAFSIGPDTEWALEVLVEAGFSYDSSVFPIRGRRYGWPGFARDIHRRTLPSGASIIEAPMSTVSVLGRRLPACGGGYLRHFPWSVTRWAMERIGRERPAIVYLHPYEIEAQSLPLDVQHLPSVEQRRVRRFHALQCRNRATVANKFERLLQSYSFAPLQAVIATAVVD